MEEKLIRLNEQGLFPGPGEKEELFSWRTGAVKNPWDVQRNYEKTVSRFPRLGGNSREQQRAASLGSGCSLD